MSGAAAPGGRTDILGVGFDGLTGEEAVLRSETLARERTGAYICTPNPEIVMMCRGDQALCEAIGGAALVLPDGIGIVRAAEMLGKPLPERVAGIDLFTALLARLRGSVYLLGGAPGVAEEAAETIRASFPGVTVAGTAHGYFENEDAAAEAIRARGPDVTAVCLGSPKQELFMARHHGPDMGLMIGLGGALDVLAGRVERAPAGWREKGFEWLWRLLQEPRRAKRQASLAVFAANVCIQRMKQWKKES